jgi:VanZ family protein
LYPLLKQYYKSIIIGGLIVWLSLSGSQSMIPGRMLEIPSVDKIGHFAMYAFFSAVLLLDSVKWQYSRSFHYLVLIIPLIFGALMEVMQMTLTKSRKAEVLDLAADIAGIAAGVIFAFFTMRFIRMIRS